MREEEPRYMHLRLHVCAAAMPMNKSRPLLRSHGEPESLFIQTFMTFPHDRSSPSPSPSAVHLFHQRVFPASSLTLLPISLLYRTIRPALSTLSIPLPISFRSKNLPSFIERSRARECTRVTSSRGRGRKKYNAVAECCVKGAPGR